MNYIWVVNGLYLVKEGKNLPLAKEQWDDAYEGKLDGSKVKIPEFTKKSRFSGKVNGIL